jgi:hypothetical protein
LEGHTLVLEALECFEMGRTECVRCIAANGAVAIDADFVYSLVWLDWDPVS